MKKIFTVTFHRANNYGAVLQAYALQKFLQKKYYTKILDYDNHKISDNYRVFKKINKNPLKTIYHFIKDIVNYRYESVRFSNFDNFRKKLDLTQKYNNKNEVENNLESCDTLICGSDQIWNPKLTGGYDDIYFLNFGNNKINRISYSGSCGNVCKISNDFDEFIDKIKGIDYLSVREESLKNMINEKSNQNAKVVVDPTLLLDKNEWLKLNIEERLINEKYIFAYSVGNENQLFFDTINLLSKKTGYMVVFFDKKDLKNKIKSKKKSFYKSGPIEFLNLLYNSEFVVTTSFHGLSFSSIFNKEIFIILSSDSDRLITLCNKFNLNNRIVNDANEALKMYDSKTNWNSVNEYIKKEREFSSNWLINAIENKGEM